MRLLRYLLTPTEIPILNIVPNAGENMLESTLQNNTRSIVSRFNVVENSIESSLHKDTQLVVNPNNTENTNVDEEGMTLVLSKSQKKKQKKKQRENMQLAEDKERYPTSSRQPTDRLNL